MMITKPIRNTFHHFSLFLALFPFLCLSSHVPFFLQSPADPPLFTARLCSLYALFFPLPYLSGFKKKVSIRSLLSFHVAFPLTRGAVSCDTRH